MNNIINNYINKYKNLHEKVYVYTNGNAQEVIDKDALFMEWAVNAYENAFKFLREQRDFLLKESDWTQVSDAPVDKAAWAEYRQALRDLPANTADPEKPVWPTPPE